jgi:phosphoglycerate dehydrogenase-like enzyme
MNNKPLCYVEIALHPKAQKQLSNVFDISTNKSDLENATAAIMYPVPDGWSKKELSKLKYIGCHSHSEEIGEWAAKNGKTVIKADVLWRTVAEHTLALCMAAARNIPHADAAVKADKWLNHADLKIKYSGHTLYNSTFGIWGMGKIGRELAKMIRGFGTNVIYHDIKRLTESEEEQLNISYRTMEQLLKESDFFCVLVPLNEENKNALAKKEFSIMKQGCILVNTARAGIINKEDFIWAMDEKILGAAALDVSWEEGMPQTDDLKERENIIFAPHLGGSTYECDMELVDGILNSMK